MVKPLLLSVLAPLAALAGTGVAAPAAAQSLGMVSLPVVFVASPVVQATHQGRAIAAARAPIAAPDQGRFVPRPDIAPSGWSQVELPRWQAPARGNDGGAGAGVDRSARDYRRGLADYGPFRVLDGRRAALLGETDAATPRLFKAMLRDHPGLAQIDMVECPGTRDDRANLQLGRMIHAAGMVTHVPASGSVRSGAVELFLAGTARDIADGAEFAVHSWRDAYGHEAADFAADAPENRRYLDYYREMGMSEREARGFYDFTNSVPHARALWLAAGEMRRWLPRGAQMAALPARRAAPPAPPRAPRIEYASVTFS